MITLQALHDDPVSIGLAGEIVTNAGHPARAMVRVASERPGLTWTNEKPLMIGYRWRREGEGEWIEGALRGIIDAPLPAEQQVMLQMPELAEEGSYQLVISLVLEQVHWAVDIDAGGWLMASAVTRSAKQWNPADFREAGGKLLVGALIASTSYSPDEDVPVVAVVPTATSAGVAAPAAAPDVATARPSTAVRQAARVAGPPLRFSRHFDRLRDAVRRWIGTNRIFAGQGDLLRLADQTYYRLEELPSRHEVAALGDGLGAVEARLGDVLGAIEARLVEQDNAIRELTSTIATLASASAVDEQRTAIMAVASAVSAQSAAQGRLSAMVEGLSSRSDIDSLTLETRAVAGTLDEFGRRLGSLSRTADALAARQPVEVACQKIDALAAELGAPIERVRTRVDELATTAASLAVQATVEAACAKVDALGGQFGPSIDRIGTRVDELAATAATLAVQQTVEAACEKVDALGGQFGPSIDRIGTRVDELAATAATLAVQQTVEAACEKVDVLGSQLVRPIDHIGTRIDELSVTAGTLAAQQTVEAACDKLDDLSRLSVIPLASLGLLLVRTRFGLLAINDDDAATIGYYSGVDLPERATVELVTKLLGPGGHFVDVGANVGAFTLVAARSVGASGRVTSFEPAPQTFAVLRRTIELNGLSPIVDAHGVALGAADGEAMLHLGATSGHHSLLDLPQAIGGEVSVPVRRGDALVGARGADLYKIDVEGWEVPVIEGLAASIERDRSAPLIVEFSARHVELAGFSADEWLTRFRALRERAWMIDDERMALRPLQRGATPPPSCNLLFADRLPAAIAAMESGHDR